jgi:hypothetical protein
MGQFFSKDNENKYEQFSENIQDYKRKVNPKLIPVYPKCLR